MATNNSAFISQQVPSRIYEDLNPSPAQITLRNTGDTVWVNFGSNAYHLGSQNPQDNQNWGTNRINLDYPVSPGNTYTFTIPFDSVSLPPHRGYNFQWRMVQDGVGWFGASSPNVLIDVEISNK